MSGFVAVDPVSGHEFAYLPGTSAEQIVELVADARRALAVEEQWRDPQVRVRTLTALARRVEAEAAALAGLQTRDTGMPPRRAQAQAAATVRLLDRVAAAVDRVEGRVLARAAFAYTSREPWGVCAQLFAATSPLATAARLAAAALAAGNAVILKPSPDASVTLLRLAEVALDAGVPPGLLAVATGDEQTGRALAEQVDHVTLSGARESAAAVALAAPLLPLELDLRDLEVLVFADADADRAAAQIVEALLDGATPRLRVEPGSDVVARLIAALAAVDVARELGPQLSAERFERATRALDAARAAGVDVHGGEPRGGLFLAPALVPAGGELSGPVVSVLPFAAPQASTVQIWTRDLVAARRLAATVRARRVGINGPAPEDVVESVLAYTRVKQVGVAPDE